MNTIGWRNINVLYVVIQLKIFTKEWSWYDLLQSALDAQIGTAKVYNNVLLLWLFLGDVFILHLYSFKNNGIS